MDDRDRRRFRRVQAPMFCRPQGKSWQKDLRAVADVSLGGLRVFADEQHTIGERLEMDLYLPDGSSVTIITEVVWVDTLEAGAAAKFDVGLRYIDLTPDDYRALDQVLAAGEEI